MITYIKGNKLEIIHKSKGPKDHEYNYYLNDKRIAWRVSGYIHLTRYANEFIDEVKLLVKIFESDMSDLKNAVRGIPDTIYSHVYNLVTHLKQNTQKRG